MRWLKHITTTRRDEKIASYMDAAKNPIEAYGFWWLLVEVIAEQMEKGDNKCSVSYTLARWSRELHCHHHTVKKYLSLLSTNNLIKVLPDAYPAVTQPLPGAYPAVTQPLPDSYWGGYEQGNDQVTIESLLSKKGVAIRVIIPNLLKYRDEFSRKSGVSPERVRSESGQTPTQEGEGDRERDRNTERDINTTTPTPAGGKVVCPQDFVPDETIPVRCKRAGITSDPCDPVVIQNFVAYYQGAGKQSANWQAEYFRWVLRESQYQKSGGSNEKRSSSRRQSGAEILAESCKGAFERSG